MSFRPNLEERLDEEGLLYIAFDGVALYSHSQFHAHSQEASLFWCSYPGSGKYLFRIVTFRNSGGSVEPNVALITARHGADLASHLSQQRHKNSFEGTYINACRL
jgi:hypothetical protein